MQIKIQIKYKISGQSYMGKIFFGEKKKDLKRVRQNVGLTTSYTPGTEPNKQQTRSINILCSDGSSHSDQRDAELGTFSIQLNLLPS